MPMKKQIAKIAAVAILTLSSITYFAYGDGCGFKEGTRTCEIDANFCNTSAPSCAKTTYSPCLSQCVSAGPTHLCAVETVTVAVTYYGGTCDGSSGCNYSSTGSEQDNPMNTVNIWGTCGG